VVKNPAKFKIIIHDRDDPYDHRERGLLFDDDAMIWVSVIGNPGPIARPSY
jgi:hypothetical protein